MVGRRRKEGGKKKKKKKKKKRKEKEQYRLININHQSAAAGPSKADRLESSGCDVQGVWGWL